MQTVGLIEARPGQLTIELRVFLVLSTQLMISIELWVMFFIAKSTTDGIADVFGFEF